MKRFLVLMTAAILFFASTVFAADVGVSYRGRTGDAQFDMSLGNLNVAARTDLPGFAADLSLAFGVPRAQIDVLLSTRGMAPADAYMAVKLANVSGRPVDVVIQEYEANKKKGWGVVAKNLGVKPGSKEFHALKNDDSGMLAKAKKKHEKGEGKSVAKEGKGGHKGGKGGHMEGKGHQGKGKK